MIGSGSATLDTRWLDPDPQHLIQDDWIRIRNTWYKMIGSGSATLVIRWWVGNIIRNVSTDTREHFLNLSFVVYRETVKRKVKEYHKIYFVKKTEVLPKKCSYYFYIHNRTVKKNSDWPKRKEYPKAICTYIEDCCKIYHAAIRTFKCKPRLIETAALF